MSTLGPIYRSTAQLDHDMAARLEDWLVDFSTLGVDRYAAHASLARVLMREGWDAGDETVDYTTVDGRHPASDEFIKVEVRTTQTQGAGKVVRIGPYEFSLWEALDLARELRGLVSRASDIEEGL